MLPSNYTLSTFPGQGAKHTLGYGMITRVCDRYRVLYKSGDVKETEDLLSLNQIDIQSIQELKPIRVHVKFESGTEMSCLIENLQPAQIPESELQFLRAKWGIEEPE